LKKKEPNHAKTLAFFKELCYNMLTLKQRKEDLPVAENKKQTTKVVAQNKKAYHDYFVDEKYEAGIALFGTEVKSIRMGAVNLKDSYCSIKNGELFVIGMHVSPYEKGNIFNREPRRERKLLMHKREIMKLFGLVGRQGVSLIPLSIYFSGKNLKLSLGVCRGKKLYDKRDALAEKQAVREIDRRLREQSKYD
jgi:SsrA-binding protein